jgi:hypothetical protein
MDSFQPVPPKLKHAPFQDLNGTELASLPVTDRRR